MKKLTFRTIVYLGLDAFLIVASLVHIPDVVRRPRAPFDVLSNGPAVLVSAIDDSSACPGLKRGDALITWGGKPVAMPEMVEYLADVSTIGAKIDVRVQRGEKAFLRTITLIPYYQSFRFLIISVFVGLAVFAVGIFIFLNRPRDIAAQALHWSLVTLGTTILITWGAVDPNVVETSLARITWFVTYLGVAVAFFTFSLVFPRERFPRLSRFSWVLVVVVIALGTAFASLHLTALWSGSVEAVDAFQAFFDSFHLVLILLVGGGLFNIARATKLASSDEERRKMYWILWGLSLGVLPYLVFHILPQVVLSEYLVPEEFTTIFFLAVPLAFAVALLKYRLFDIEVLINRTIVYGVLSAFLVAAYGLTVLLMTSVIGEIVFEQYFLVAGLTLVVGALINPLRLRLQKVVDGILFAARADYRRALSGAMTELHQSLGRGELYHHLVGAVRKVVPGEMIAAYELDSGVLRLRSVWGMSPEARVEIGRDHSEVLLSGVPIISMRAASSGATSLDPGMEKWLSDRRWSVFVPIISGSKELLGALVLNPRSGEAYQEEELNFLQSVADETSELLERLMLQEKIFLAHEEQRRLKELSALKSYFISSVSHELRMPLTSIRMFAEMLRAKSVKSPRLRREYLEIIEGESERLSRLIGNILDFAQIERGMKEYRYAPTDLREVMKRSSHAIRYQVLSHGATLRIRVERNLPLINADGDALEEAILNLLSNAIKYSTTVKKIDVRVSRSKGRIRIEVADKGVGIAEEELPHIFARFYRVRNEHTRQVGGAGLGLALVKHIVEAHGGAVTVSSVVGRGTTFTLDLPISPVRKRKNP